MAITKSAKKAMRQNERRKAHNLIYKNKIKSLIKEARILAKDKIEEAKKLLPLVYRALDKAAKVGIIKKNTADRKKSRITRMLNPKPK